MDGANSSARSAGGLLAVPLSAEAQPATKTSRIGYLSPTFASEPDNRRRLGALREGLRDLGYVEGQNITIETRWAEGQYGRLPDLAAELVHLKVDVIVTYVRRDPGGEQARGRPIVMAGISIGGELCPSLARREAILRASLWPEWSGSSGDLKRRFATYASRRSGTLPRTSPQLRHARRAPEIEGRRTSRGAWSPMT